MAGLIAAPGGTIYGTTQLGGASGLGTVFPLKPPVASGPWTQRVLYSFVGGLDGEQPVAGLLASHNGTLYGTTKLGGASSSGTVFALTPPTSPGGAWTESVLYSFTGGSDGGTPVAGLIFGPSGGTLYGTTEYGGKIYSANCRFTGCGTAFKLTPPATVGGAWAEHVLYEFQGTGVGSNDGSNPLGGLVADATGALYGTTQGGGFAQVGTVFKLTPPATSGSRWTEGILHFFVTSSGDGISPFAGLVFSNHELYGTTQIGGSVGEHFGGTVFEVTP